MNSLDETSNFGGGWHTDLIYKHQPPSGTMLYALETPRRGGDTMFADGVLAYNALSEGMQTMLAGLDVIYSVKHVGRAIRERGDALDGKAQGKTVGKAANRSMPAASDQQVLDAEPVHPLVRRHPVTTQKCLYFSRGHTIQFAGMTPAESAPLLDWLQAHMTQPVFTTRLHWQPGTMAYWDNRCVSHYALNDYHGERRHLHRLTIEGDIPRS